MSLVDEQTVWQALNQVSDPEIPVVSVVDLGIVRDVTVTGDAVRVAITPTFAGCPALYLMREEIEAAVRGLGVAAVEVVVKLDPPWTSELISKHGRAQLKAIGLAPPERVPSNGSLISLDDITLLDGIACPFCDSHETRLESPFGPTMCRALYYCRACQQPFEKFKAL